MAKYELKHKHKVSMPNPQVSDEITFEQMGKVIEACCVNVTPQELSMMKMSDVTGAFAECSDFL
jgi:hypothetical protein